MNSYLKLTIFVIFSTTVPLFSAQATDFDGDGLADVVLVDIDSNNKLEWYAMDINDQSRRSLGELGVIGNHLALGRWSGTANASKGVVRKLTSGAFEWEIGVSGGNKKFTFGSYPATVVSGLDADANGAIDPAVVAVGATGLEWKVLHNPTLVDSPTTKETRFGGKKAVPFFANLDGTGDRIANASVNSKGTLTIRTKSLSTNKLKTITVHNFKSTVSSVLPVRKRDGKDLLFVVSRSGNKFTFTIVDGKNRVKKVSVKGDSTHSVVVDNFVGTDHDIVAVRTSTSKVVLIEQNGRKTTVSLGLEGIIADDININSFDASEPGKVIPAPRSPIVEKTNPVCSGVMVSTLHLLYKPVSDTSGNAVLVFDGVYKKEFQSVKIQLRDGTFEIAYWKGLALWGNPDKVGPRQHWRTSKRASQIADNALIIANDGKQECQYRIPGSSNRRWE